MKLALLAILQAGHGGRSSESMLSEVIVHAYACGCVHVCVLIDVAFITS